MLAKVRSVYMRQHRLKHSMARRLIFAIGIVASSCTAPAPVPSTRGQPTIFREVSFQPFAAVVLGEPLPPRAPPTVPQGTLLSVSKSGFGGADSIYFRLGVDGRVNAMFFVYPLSDDFTASIKEYEGDLGPPVQRESVDSAGGKIERVLWRDSLTEFALSRFTQAGVVRRYSSALIDRHAGQ
jgi:hypothetical protein